MNSLATLIALSSIPGIGGVTLRNLLERFGDVEAIRRAGVAELQAVPGVGPKTAEAIRILDTARTAADIVRWEKAGISILTWSHLLYPDALFHLRDAPPVLYCRGALSPADMQAVGVVGTRHPTPSARRFAETLGQELARRKWTVVSGLAWGVDLAAHSGAIRAGRTLAILGEGVSQIPARKQALADQIMERGAVLSEVLPDASPNPPALVARNRLISGMSRAVIVIEAGEDSGSLYTARFALKQNRPIFAVDNGSGGNTLLLQNGAHPLPPDFNNWDALADTLAGLS